MTKRRSTKGALLMSVLSLFLCFSMLLGTTFAWFTDEVESGKNVIKSGNLDITLEYYNGTEWLTVEGASAILDETALWEPGYTEVAYFRIKNNGTLALKYQFGVNIVSETEGVNKANEPFKLSDYIYFDVVEGVNGETARFADRNAAMANATETTKISAGYSKAGELEAGSAYVYLAMVIYMPTSVGNAANHNGTAPSIELGVNVVASQVPSEKDSYDENYDAGAAWTGDVNVEWYDPTATEFTISSAEELAGLAAIVNGTAKSPVSTFAADGSDTLLDYFAGKTIKLEANIDLNNMPWTPIGSATADHGFMGNFDGNGKTISNLNITNIVPDADNYAYAGFFGVTEGDAGAENFVKNVTFENVTINTDGHIVAAAIAYPYYTTVENVTVCGDIKINGGDYTSGVLAYTRRCTTASNISICGNDGSYITGHNTVGGVISDIQTNGGIVANYSNFSASNITVTGNKCVGGISGIIGGQTLNGATVENIELVCSDAHVGIVAGSYDSKPVINNVTYSNVTGATAIAGAPYSTNSNGIVIIDGVECAGNVDTFKAQLSTGTVNLACDIALDEIITIAKGQTVVINLNGNTISGTCNAGQGHLFMVNNGAKLTVCDNSAAQSGKITFAQGTSNTGWTIDLEGELVLESGTIELTGDSWSIGYAVDVRPNAWGTAYQYPTVFTMNGGKIVSSDGAIRVASSSSESYTGVSAKFVMNGGEIEAAWDGIFIQQSNAVYDILTVELNGGKIASALSPVRVYGPVATSVVGGAEKPMTLKIGAAAELSVIGEIDTTRTWYKNGVVVLGGGMTVEALEQYSTIVIAQ